MKQICHLLLALCLGTIAIEARAQTNESHSFTNINRLIPDGNWSGWSESLSLTSSIARLDSLRIKLQITGEFNGDLYAYLRHTTQDITNFCVLLNRPGRSAANSHGYPDMGFDVILDSSPTHVNIHEYQTVTNLPDGIPLSGTWQPDGRPSDPEFVLDTDPVATTLATFKGATATGTWTLFVADVDMGATNVLAGCQLEMAGAIAPSLSWPAPADIVYGTPLSPSQLNATANGVSGTFAYQPTNATILPAGTNTLHVVFTPEEVANYSTVITQVTILVVPKDLTIQANSAAKTYDGLPVTNDPGFTCEGFVNDESTNILDGTLTLTGNWFGATSAGVYEIIPGGASNRNYSITFLNGQVSINQALLHISANNENKVYNGEEFHGGRASFEGFVNNESSSVLSGSPVFGGSAQGATNAGEYEITVSGYSSRNYAVTNHPGKLVILQSATIASLDASPNPVKPAAPLSLVAHMTSASGGGIPTGWVQFLTNGVPFGGPVPLTQGSATNTVNTLPVGLYAVSVQYAGDQNFLSASATVSDLLVNTQPVAEPDTIVRFGTNDVKVAISTLLSNDSDADGDLITFLEFSATGTNSGTIIREGNWLFYVPTAESTNSDMFTYTISDGRGTPVTGNVSVLAVPDLLPSPNLQIAPLPGGSCLLTFDAIPGLQYRIEYCENINAPVWITLASKTADSTGVIQYIDGPHTGSPARYYRTVFP